MYCSILSGGLVGLQAYPVHVEVDIARGLPGFGMVGRLSGEVRESKERVQVALKNVGLQLPPTHITVNLSPADIRKEGTAFDLPIAVGILQSMQHFGAEATDNILFLGELGLDGEVKPVRGVLPIVRDAAARGVGQCIVPRANAAEAALIPDVVVRGVGDIRQLIDFLQLAGSQKDAAMRRGELDRLLPRATVNLQELFCAEQEGAYDFAEVNGQEVAKRAAEIAAAGFHSLLLIGPPGAGKSMIARRIPDILPPLTMEESLEVTAVMSVAGMLGEEILVTRRPFQNPHHTVSQAALVGGGANPRPGLLSMAHRGVLFLDEFPEFQRNVIDSMRQPLEEKVVRLARNLGNVIYPADFMLVCAMNPCPCGYYPDPNKCKCTQAQVHRYAGRVSGPIMDRMDLCVEMQPVDFHDLSGGKKGEDSASIRERVLGARHVQEERFAGSAARFNADMGAEELERFCPLGSEEQACVEQLFRSMQMSVRGYHRLLKVARTIADLEGVERIGTEHLLEAACFRQIQQ